MVDVDFENDRDLGGGDTCGGRGGDILIGNGEADFDFVWVGPVSDINLLAGGVIAAGDVLTYFGDEGAAFGDDFGFVEGALGVLQLGDDIDGGAMLARDVNQDSFGAATGGCIEKLGGNELALSAKYHHDDEEDTGDSDAFFGLFGRGDRGGCICHSGALNKGCK